MEEKLENDAVWHRFCSLYTANNSPRKF